MNKGITKFAFSRCIAASSLQQVTISAKINNDDNSKTAEVKTRPIGQRCVLISVSVVSGVVILIFVGVIVSASS